MRFLPVALAVLLAGCVAPAGPDPPGAAPPVRYEAVEFTTSMGAFTLLLYPEAAPETVALAKAYVAEGYYVGKAFTRTVPGHVIQLTAGRGQTTEDERRVPLEPHPAYHFTMGAAGIARGEDPGSGGPQFFIMDFATSHLDGNFTVWGQVVSGMEVVHRIARVPAVDLRPHSALPFLVGDRQAIEPPVIEQAVLVEVLLPAEEAARLPGRVAQNLRAGEFRHSAQWPADLRAGGDAEVGWYVRPYNLTAPPAASDLVVRVGSAELPLAGNAEAPGAYSFRWTPPAAGTYEATLVWRGEPMATLSIEVGP